MGDRRTLTRGGRLSLALAAMAVPGLAFGQSAAPPLPPPRPVPGLERSWSDPSPPPATPPAAIAPVPPRPTGAGPNGVLEIGEPLQRPGSFAFEPTRLPGHFLKEKLVAPRVDPPVEFGISRRSSIGLFGDVGPVDPKGVAPVRVLNRDIGAGVTFQYRFGD